MAWSEASTSSKAGLATSARACGLGVATLYGGLAHGQEPATAPGISTLERVIVTGTHIPQTDIEGALPVQVIRREEIERSGVTTVEQLLERVPANFNPFNAAATIGEPTRPGLSSANLRGLGGGSTLVLLNGRRLANYAFDGESVDLNSIPLAAIDRVEVLKDGASAIYGTDATAGVINFILRRDFVGAEISADIAATQHGGGNSGYVNAALGTGDPARDGYNLFAALSYQKDQALKALDRDFARTSYRPDLGRDRMNLITFPANTFGPNRSWILNPSSESGCAPPSSIPFKGPPYNTPACGFDYPTSTDLMPVVERASAMLRGTWRADTSLDVFAEALIGRNRFDTQIAPLAISDSGTSFGRPVYPAGGPYYPSAFAAANGISGNLSFSYRATELGPRLTSTTSDMHRYVLGAQGQAAGWDFDLAAVYSANSQAQWYGGSFAYYSKIIPALNSGLINPWGPSSPEGSALLASTLYSGTPQTAHGSTSLVNAYASRNIAQLAAGPLAVALGAELRRESLSYDYDPAVLTGDSPIGDGLHSISGSRGVFAFFAELNVPIANGLDAQLAARFDDYSDFGATTNPKVALRWQPMSELLLRGSWGTGFRAPPLYSLNEPPRTEEVAVEDPIRCPVTGSPQDCGGSSIPLSLGGNPTLQPETSTQWNLGLVLEPARGLSIGIDYWNIVQEGIIVPLDIGNALRYSANFSDRVIRGPADPAYPDLPGPIAAIDVTPINLGITKTSGIDVFFSWAMPAQPWGQLRVGLQGTYVRQWETQIDGVNYVSMLGSAVYGAPVPRWRSTLTFDWTRGPWSAALSQMYSSGYVETRPVDGQLREVGAAESWDLQARYAGFDGWQLAAGIRNLFDAESPASLTGLRFQSGYNPQAASPLGRVFYLRASYSFK